MHIPAESATAVLHITAAAGGGADRYIRDLAASTTRPHFVLHVGESLDVLENIAAKRFVPLAPAPHDDILSHWVRASDVGIAHLHSVDLPCRRRLADASSAARLPYLVTLHDLTFVNPRAFEAGGMPQLDRDWIAEVSATLCAAASVIAPSAYIRDVARRQSEEMSIGVIAPGIAPFRGRSAPLVPPDFASQKAAHVVAVVGAVGPHKGSGMLVALAGALQGSNVTIAVIGYTDTVLTRGWVVPRHLYVHGPYVNDALAGWLAAYGVEIVLFPNLLPESFSYTLSEVWAASLPVIVPDAGALGERVAAHGGGWRLPERYGVADAVTLLTRLFTREGVDERARVKSMIRPADTVRIPTLEAMSRDVEALYARYALPSTAREHRSISYEALAPLLAANLNGFVFRKELLSLAGQLEQAKADVAEATRWSAQLERDSAAWAAKLEADIATLRRDHTAEIKRHTIEHERLEEQNLRLTDENRRLAKQNARLDADNRRFADDHQRVADDNRRIAKQNALLAEESRRLTQELAKATTTLEDSQRRVAELERQAAARIAAHESAVATKTRDHERSIEDIKRRFADQLTALSDERRALTEELARVNDENRRLRDEIARLGAYQAAFEVGPQILQRYLLRKLSRARR